jgi:hypothetical protein
LGDLRCLREERCATLLEGRFERSKGAKNTFVEIYKLKRISTSRSTKFHSSVSLSSRTSRSKPFSCSGAYSNYVRKSNGWAVPKSRQLCSPLGDAGQMSEPFLNVVRTFFEDLSTLILGELPH